MGEESRKIRELRNIKITAAALIVVAVVLISGVIYVGMTSKRGSGTVLVYCTANHALTLDPADADDIGSIAPISNIYETLIRYSSDEEALGFLEGLATSWTTSTDGLWYNFTLRERVRFSNGNLLTASDVRFSIERVLSMDSPNTGIARILSRSIDLNSTQALDDCHLSIKLKEPYAGFLATIAQPFPLSILDRESTLEHYSAADKYAHDFMSSNPIGTGPYMLERWQKGSEVVLVKNPLHWRGWSGNHTDKVVIKEVADAESITSALQAGKADIADVPISNLSDIAGYPDLVAKTFRTYDIEIAVMNMAHSRTSHSFMKDPKVRQALSYAFDYLNTSVQLYQGHMEGLNGCIPNGLPFSAESQPMKRFIYNLNLASDLLNSSGYFLDVANHRFNGTTMELVVQGGDPLRMASADSYAVSLRRLGVFATVEEGNSSILEKSGNWDMFFAKKALRYPDPDDYVTQLLVSSASGGDFFRSGISDSIIDSAARAASASMSESSRLRAYGLIWQESNENPNMILIGQLDCVLVSKNLAMGFQFDPVMRLDFYTLWRSA
ncbi:MAG: ABC transporter substrate-binding protein [Thermoplasmata archaeon]|nr:ABC transporter substrate-binding protein [Thermoplasmata archaeon]